MGKTQEKFEKNSGKKWKQIRKNLRKSQEKWGFWAKKLWKKSENFN